MKADWGQRRMRKNFHRIFTTTKLMVHRPARTARGKNPMMLLVMKTIDKCPIASPARGFWNHTLSFCLRRPPCGKPSFKPLRAIFCPVQHRWKTIFENYFLLIILKIKDLQIAAIPLRRQVATSQFSIFFQCTLEP
jgi:hypothetical protein